MPPTPVSAQFGSCLEVVSDLLGFRPQRPGEHAQPVLVVKGGERPRFVVPTATPAAAAASCLAYNRLRSRRTRAQRAVIGTALRVGAARFWRGDRYSIDTSEGSLFAHLRELLGRDDLCIAVGLGNFDTVWKPTLQIMSRAGHPVAYVKVGWTPFTRSLVETEATTLGAIGGSGDRRVVAPDLLHRSVWRDKVLVTVSPLPLDVRRIADDHDVPSPEVVRDLGATRASAPLAETPWWQRLTSSVLAGADHPSDGPLATAVSSVAEAFGDTVVTTARLHGDWTPWNLARSPSRGLVAWDWEYSSPDGPVGLDELHSAFQVYRLLDGDPARTAFRQSAATAERWLAAVHPLMVAERVQAALRAGCELDDGGAESLREAPAAVEAALR